MATWKAKREALRQTIIYCLGLSTLDENGSSKQYLVQFEGQREMARWTKGIWCDLRLGMVRVVGRDETRQVQADGVDEILNSYGGQRSFTLMVVVSSDDQEDQDAIGTATTRLRTRIRRPEVQDMLAAVDIGFSAILSTINVDYEDDGAQVSSSMTELRLNTVEDDTDLPGSGMDWIAEVQGDGETDSDVDDVEIQAGPVDP